MTVAGIISNKISRVMMAAATVVTAAILAFSGLAPVGAQSAGTYQCGTYGGGNYDQTDCTDSTTTTPPSSGGTPTPTNNSGTGSGGSGTNPPTGTGTTTPTAGSTILLNDFSEYTSTAGKTLTFKVGDVFHFNLSGEAHTITVKSFDKSNLIVTIASTPTDVTVPMGQTVNYDVDQDGTADIAITYSTYATDGASATAVYRSLASTSDTTTSPTTGSSQNTSTGGTTSTPQSSTSMWWVWLIPVVLGIGLLIWAILAAKKRKAAAASGGSNFNQF